MPIEYDFYNEFMRPAVATAGMIDQSIRTRLLADRNQAEIAEGQARMRLSQAALDQKMREEEQWNGFKRAYAGAFDDNVATLRQESIKNHLKENWADPDAMRNVQISPQEDVQIKQQATENAFLQAASTLPPSQIPGVLDKMETRWQREQTAREGLQTRKEIADQTAGLRRDIWDSKNATQLQVAETRAKSAIDVADIRAQALRDRAEMQNDRAIDKLEMASKDLPKSRQIYYSGLMKEILKSTATPEVKAQHYDLINRQMMAELQGQPAPAADAPKSAQDEHTQTALDQLDEFEKLGYDEATIEAKPGGGYKLTPITGWWDGATTVGEKKISDIRDNLTKKQTGPLPEIGPKDTEKYKALKSGQRYYDDKGNLRRKP